MFNKPTFGANTSFGSFNTGAAAASPFGGFKPGAAAPGAGGASGFGAPPAFGAAPAQPNTGALFGSTNTTSGLFGTTTSTAAPAFGANTSGFGFGAGTSSGSLFGANTTSTGLFGNAQNTSAFGAKPGGFGFGGTPTAATTGGSLFGATAPTSGLFGQTNTMGTGLFSNTNTFGQSGGTVIAGGGAGAGSAHAKYCPVLGTDVVVKSGSSQTVNIKHHCITCMKEYENKSLEELRLEDYTAGRKGAAGGGMFGFQQQEAKPLFAGSTFGQTATTTASSVFGGGGLGTTAGFGQTNTFSFGSNAQNAPNTTGGLFGAAKPAFGTTATTGTGLFGSTTTQAPTFGSTTAPSFGFGSNTQNQQPGTLFGAKPAGAAFGAAAGGGGFGAFGAQPAGGLFNKPPQQPAPHFGAAQPAFGALSGGFGAQPAAGGGLFGAGNTFGKPATAQPAFGFNAPATGLGTGLGTGLTNTFQAKPATSAFGTLGGGSLFQQPAANNFSTGLDGSLGGGGLFGNSSALGGGALGLGGLGAQQAQQNNLQGAAAGNVHEQILTLVARPYGNSPLFKDLPADSASPPDVLKPTNPAAVAATLQRAQAQEYRLTSPRAPLRLNHVAAHKVHDKKSLFDGLEESDTSLEDKLSLKPSRKRLVLRPRDDVVDGRNRSSDQDQSQYGVQSPKEPDTANKSVEGEQHKKDTSGYGENNNLENSSDRHESWLNASKHQWSAEKEKLAADEPTPRLYPNLDKEVPSQGPERRASWLTTKPLRKPLSANPDSVENSVRELVGHSDRGSDKENVDILSVSEEEQAPPRDQPPHPTGVKQTRPGYYTIPSLDEMIKYMRSDGTCVVPHLTVGRKNYGSVYYDCEIDVAGLDIDALVYFMNKEITVYPDDSAKPPVGEALNRRAIVTLDRVWPRDKTEKRPITDPDRLLSMDFEGKLRRVCDKHDTKFLEYRPQTGSWVFRVEHFSKYSLTDSDEEDELTPEVLRRQVANQQLQKAAPIAPPKPPGLGGPAFPPGLAFPPASLASSSFAQAGPSLGVPGYGALGAGLVPLSSLGMPVPPLVGHDDLYAMQQTSLNLLNGAGKAFEMDTTEENTESQSMYQDSQRAFGVKSPTTELARLEHRQSHNVQLMKASLYADTEMEDDVSVSTGDQQVPRAVSLRHTAAPSIHRGEDMTVEEIEPLPTEELPMRPLMVRPHTVVLKYHRKVPPYNKTIAGRMQWSQIADMSVCRARHSRVGFGPRQHLVYVTALDAVSALPESADLCDLGKYVSGRGRDDWSESVVTHLAIGQYDAHDTFLETFTRYLDTLMQFSTSTGDEPGSSPRLAVRADPAARRAALSQLVKDAAAEDSRPRFGVTTGYCHEVFRLCEALWGADLENDGIPGTDEAAIVNRHKRLLEWLTDAVNDVTEQELKKPREPDPIDETDTHSAQVWVLLLGGRLAAACKTAVQHGDCNMAALLAQCAGDPTFRSLVSRQLYQWRECGADARISSLRLAACRLLAGTSTDQLATTDWLRALHATARYLCPQVASLEQIVRKYNSLFVRSGETETGDETEDVDLYTVEADELGLQLPLPPYQMQYAVNVQQNGKQRRVLDLRYELIRARAMNARPKLQPAAYTADPMDYSLCFVVSAWLGSVSGEVAGGAAAQLEAAGHWHRAVQALLYHPDQTARNHLIQGVLSRHAPARANTPELRDRLQLLRTLRVPDKWLLTAQAHRAKYERLPAVEAEHLVGAEQWNAAHKVLLEELLPEAVLADDLQSIAPLLEKLNEAAQKNEVSGWDCGGQALHHYIHVCDEIRGLVSSAQTDRASVSSRLSALRPRVSAACRALTRLPARAPPPRAAAARAEMGARLVQLALAAGEPPAHLAALLKALKLPPDCTALAQHKITTDLAEQASDLCIESTNSSPISSHHRTTVQS